MTEHYKKMHNWMVEDIKFLYDEHRFFLQLSGGLHTTVLAELDNALARIMCIYRETYHKNYE